MDSLTVSVSTRCPVELQGSGSSQISRQNELSTGAGRRECSQQHVPKFIFRYVSEARCNLVLGADPPSNPSPLVKLEHVMQTGIRFLLN